MVLTIMGDGAKICFGKAKKSFYNSLESCIPRFVNNFFMGLSAILIGLGLGYESKAWRKFQVFPAFCNLKSATLIILLGKKTDTSVSAVSFQLGSQLHRGEV